jgi:hypothetical protein
VSVGDSTFDAVTDTDRAGSEEPKDRASPATQCRPSANAYVVIEQLARRCDPHNFEDDTIDPDPVPRRRWNLEAAQGDVPPS